MPRRTARKALLARMQATIDTHAERTAVRSPTTRMSYGDFSQLIGRLCRELRSPVRAQRTPVGLLLERSAAAYAAMWAAIALGRPYVPLNEKYPSSRLRSIVTQAGIDVVICTEASRNLATRLGFTPENTVMAEGRIPAGEPGGAYADWTQTENDAAIAYILFTSGSTGEPKGVPISYENLYGFIENMSAVVDYNCEDVCSQMIELFVRPERPRDLPGAAERMHIVPGPRNRPLQSRSIRGKERDHHLGVGPVIGTGRAP